MKLTRKTAVRLALAVALGAGTVATVSTFGGCEGNLNAGFCAPDSSRNPAVSWDSGRTGVDLWFGSSEVSLDNPWRVITMGRNVYKPWKWCVNHVANLQCKK